MALGFFMWAGDHSSQRLVLLVLLQVYSVEFIGSRLVTFKTLPRLRSASKVSRVRTFPVERLGPYHSTTITTGMAKSPSRAHGRNGGTPGSAPRCLHLDQSYAGSGRVSSFTVRDDDPGQPNEPFVLDGVQRQGDGAWPRVIFYSTKPGS